MQLNKYILTSALAITLAFSGTASASTALIVGNTIGAVGEQIDVPITITNPANTAGASFTVTYDTTALQLDELNSNFFPLFTSMGIPSADPFVYDGDDYYRAVVGSIAPTGAMIAAARTTTGATENDLFTLRFTILAGATEPSYGINIQPSIISNTAAGYNSGGESVPMLVGINGSTYPEEPVTGVTPGTVTISGVPSPGDSDGDGIEDQWERDNVPAGVDPNSPEALNVFSSTGDYDHDGYSDLQEYLNGSSYDPIVPDAPGGTGYNPTTDKPTSKDFDGDGHSDILLRHTNGAIYTWIMADNGTSIESGDVIYNPLSDDWTILGMGDFDGDGHSDILLRHTNGAIYTWIMADNGTSIERGGVIYNPLPDDWTILGMGDFDGDGHSDILLRHTNGAIYTWIMADNGTSIESGDVIYNPLSDDWTILGMGDFDGDGHSDILLRHTNGAIYTWIMADNGTSIERGGVIYNPLPDDWTILGMGDFDGDGHSDILLRHTNGAIYTWIMADIGTSIESGGVIYNPLPDDWTILGMGDFDGDGHSDILLRHTNGAIYTWIMADNGTSIERGGVIYNPLPDDWDIQ